MPVYNQKRYICAAVHSILAQSFHDFELIIVDDGSTDGTTGRLAGLHDRRIRIVARPHCGFRQALEAGVREARGEWIARMDSDDVCHPRRLERQLGFVEAHPECVFVGTAYGFVTPNDRFLAPESTFDWRYVEAEHITLGGRVFADPSTVFSRRKAFDVGLYDLEYDNENPLWYKLLSVGQGAVLGETLYYARWLCNSLSRSLNDDWKKAYLPIRMKYDPRNAERLKRPTPLSARRADLGMLARGIDHYLVAGDRAACRELAWKAWRKWPLHPRTTKFLIQSLLGNRSFRFWQQEQPSAYRRVGQPW